MSGSFSRDNTCNQKLDHIIIIYFYKNNKIAIMTQRYLMAKEEPPTCETLITMEHIGTSRMSPVR